MALIVKPVPGEVRVSRSDPVYNAHSYLTKVPVAAIRPFIEAFTEPGELVIDVFAGSGMTGVAAAMTGRRAVLFDISVLGQHIGRNYVTLVDADPLRQAANAVVAATSRELGDVYGTACSGCGRRAELSRRTWSVVVQCRECAASVNYYRALEAAGWNRSKMVCPSCGSALALRSSQRAGEAPVLDTISCSCSRTMIEQAPTAQLRVTAPTVPTWPDVRIDPDRQMFQASALGKHNLLTVASFYSMRNLVVLGELWAQIGRVPSQHLRQKLQFVFTAILARASKRYQWSRKRPLNAATHNYYIAPVFYEWNVLDLFLRKVEAIISSDDYIRGAIGGPLLARAIDVEYRLSSADQLELEDASVDYVFTDPPFGSNIFYSDMNLFHEAWLGNFTDRAKEAVVDRSGNRTTRRSAERYEALLVAALRECHRVLKPNRWLSLVFSNSSGELWALLQRAIATAGFAIDPDSIAVLDKGQRSVKGLASGFEDVVTVDLIVSMQKVPMVDQQLPVDAHQDLEDVLYAALSGSSPISASHVYLQVIREYLKNHWSLAGVDYSAVSAALGRRGFITDPATGRLLRSAPA